MKKSGGQINLPSRIFYTACTLMSKSPQPIFDRLSDLARELLAICFIDDTVSWMPKPTSFSNL
jgi:hypothetical protein